MASRCIVPLYHVLRALYKGCTRSCGLFRVTFVTSDLPKALKGATALRRNTSHVPRTCPHSSCVPSAPPPERLDSCPRRERGGRRDPWRDRDLACPGRDRGPGR